MHGDTNYEASNSGDFLCISYSVTVANQLIAWARPELSTSFHLNVVYPHHTLFQEASNTRIAITRAQCAS